MTQPPQAPAITTAADEADGTTPPDAFATRRMVTARQIAERLGVTDPLIYKLRRLRKMPAPYRIATSTRWDADEIEAWIQTLREPERDTAAIDAATPQARPVDPHDEGTAAPTAKARRPGPRRTAERAAAEPQPTNGGTAIRPRKAADGSR